MDIAQAIRDGHGVKGVIRKRQLHAIASHLGHVALTPSGQHATGEITRHAPRTRLGKFHGGHGGTRCKVQDLLARLQVQTLAGALAPVRVLPKGQHGIGEVVFLAHGVKHARHIEGLFIQICLRHK